MELGRFIGYFTKVETQLWFIHPELDQLGLFHPFKLQQKKINFFFLLFKKTI
jgi:hypothetical protein